MTHPEAIKIAENAIAMLMEHFDNVQVLGSWMEDGETSFVSTGAGNWFARTGHAERWLQDGKDSILAQQIGDELKEDDGDDWREQEVDV